MVDHDACKLYCTVQIGYCIVLLVSSVVHSVAIQRGQMRFSRPAADIRRDFLYGVILEVTLLRLTSDPSPHTHGEA